MYDIAIAFYAAMVRIASLFHRKARLMIKGHQKTFPILEAQIQPNHRYIWFHAASLGEFEQGRPLIEKIRKDKPEYKILLTFFSPSGYEIRKDYPGADIVCYLPFDFKRNVKKFLDLANPEMAIFIKYEFWMNYLTLLKKRDIPIYIISAIFRPNQIFFRWYGIKYRDVLDNYNWFFVQDQNSMDLLKKLNHSNVSISGDTRFDRVEEIFRKRKEIPIIPKFLNQADTHNNFVLVAGSTWEKDEEIIISYFNQHPEIKLIIAPHEIKESRIKEIKAKLTRSYVLYSEATEKNIESVDCLIMDCFGLLSSTYRYGQIAYVGGGFGVGIHNILEAAVYGIPVLFGPNYKRFKEAKELIAANGAFSIRTEEEFTNHVNNFLSYPTLLEEDGKSAKNYVINNLGATQKIYEKIFFAK